MVAARKSDTRPLEVSYEILSLLNLILAAIFYRAATERTWLDPILIRGKLDINHLLRLHPHSDIGSSVTLFGLGALGALILWLPLRTFSQRLSNNQIFHFLFGAMDLVAAPTAWMYVFQPRWFPFSLEQARFLPIECTCVVIFAVLYLNDGQILPTWVMLPIIAGHYGLWFWIFWESGGPSLLMMLVMGLCSSLLWAARICKKRMNRKQNPKFAACL